jgi:hypothetical protein
MTSRERITAALQHRQADRTPYFEYVLLSPLADRLLGRPYAGNPQNWDDFVQLKGWKDAVHQSAVDQLDLALRLWARGKDEPVWIGEVQDVQAGETIHVQGLEALFDLLKQRTNQAVEPKQEIVLVGRLT